MTCMCYTYYLQQLVFMMYRSNAQVIALYKGVFASNISSLLITVTIEDYRPSIPIAYAMNALIIGYNGCMGQKVILGSYCYHLTFVPRHHCSPQGTVCATWRTIENCGLIHSHHMIQIDMRHVCCHLAQIHFGPSVCVCLSAQLSTSLSVEPYICLSCLSTVSLSVHPPVCSSICRTVSFPLRPSVHSVCIVCQQSVCLFIHLSVHPPVKPSPSLSVHLFIQLYICPSIYLSVYLSIHLSVCPSIYCLSVCLSDRPNPSIQLSVWFSMRCIT